MDKSSSMKDFDVLAKLGEGAFGVVFKVKRKADNKEYAIKKVKLIAMKDKERENAVNEIRILASLNDDYIIGYKDAFYDETSSTLCVVMEYASGGDILRKINNHIKSKSRYPEQEIWKALVHMTKGLKALHDKKILHRDLKCANVFITGDGTYKLGDLNVSKVLKKGLAYTQTGTPYYASPEVWNDKPYDMKSDIWSLGCVIYEMAALRPPFQASDLQGLYRKIKAGIFDRIPSMYSSDLANMISNMLKMSPAQRPSTDQILSNPIVARHYSAGGLLPITTQKAQLLQTIKFNPYNLKALKDKLPRANYFKERKEDDRDYSQDRIQTEPRQRVLSACGIRRIAESPKENIPKKEEPQQNIFKNDTNPQKLPPLPGKLPPKQIASNNPSSVVSPNVGYHAPSPRVSREARSASKEREEGYYKISSERQRSREHLRNIGANIVNPVVIPRSSSVQRIPDEW